MTESLDPVAAERVLRRANAIADDTDGADDAAADAGYEPAALIAAAQEVGISEVAVRHSLAIERLGAMPAGRRFDGVVGPAVVVADRVVRGAPDEVLERVDRWMVAGHRLRRERRRPDECEWSRRDDLLAACGRIARSLVGEGRLGDVRRAHAVVAGIDDERSVVRVSLDRRRRRRTTVIAGSALGGTGVAVGVAGVIATAPIAVAAIPIGLGAGVAVVSGRRQADRFDVELRRLLDAVEDERPPQGVLRGIGRRVALRRSG